MTISVKILLVSFFVVLMSACGGGGGSSSPSSPTNNPTPPPPAPPPPTASEKIGDAQSYTASELKTAATQLMNERYTGTRSNASINPVLSQQVFNLLFGNTSTELPNVGEENFADHIDVNGNIDINFACHYTGSARYVGKLDANLKGNLTITYTNCGQYNNNGTIFGTVAMTVSEISENSSDITFYFDNLRWRENGVDISASGYSNLVSTQELNQNRYTIVNKQHVALSIGQQQVMLDAELSLSSDNFSNTFDLVGDLYISDEGKIAFKLNDINGYPPYIYSGTLELTGDKLAAFDFGNSHVRYAEDNNNDGEYDIGAYYADINALLNSGSDEKKLVALEDLSLPPYAGYVYRNNYEPVYVNTPIVVETNDYYDPDTNIEDLQISFRWYINDEIVEDVQGNTLPAGSAVFGDLVAVRLVVSDGPNVVVGQPHIVQIEDSPAQVNITNVPESIKPGDAVQFLAAISDPDIGDLDAASALVSGPEGSSIDNDGLVSWTVPTDLLFTYQTYEFVFAVPQENGSLEEITTITLDVESGKPFPIARSGIEVPRRNGSMWVADFDGDNVNEVLATDSLNKVFLMSFIDGDYQQKWVYPFRVPGEGAIVQVLPVQVDEDTELEILVARENSLIIINGLDTIPTVIMNSDNFINFVTAEDIDGDGISEIAYLHSTNSYSSSNISVSALSLSNPQQVLFTTDVSEAKQIIFANVDNDASYELITDNGLVYDATSWLNEWFSGVPFGLGLVTAGDYNGDGIDEIVGADRWGAITVYSAVDKSQLDSFDNFNTCTLASDDINNDGEDELLVGDCQWGNITAYKLISNSLSELWQVNMQDHGSVSLVSGDSDNDGITEIHWGTGVSSSGADSFVVADVDGDSVGIKERSESVQLDGYSTAGWSNITDNQDRAVFFIPSTQSGYDGSRYLTMDKQGDYQLSGEISSNWDNSSLAVTTDFNNDGLGDIFLPSTQTYDGSFSVLQLNDGSVHWETSGEYSSDIGIIRAYDLNADSYDDAVYADSSVLRAVDVQNQLVIGNYTFNTYINDFVPTHINGLATVIVAFGERLSMLTLNGAVFSEQSFVEQSCSRLELINYDTDAQMELVCLTQAAGYYNAQELVVFELTNSTMTEVKRSEIVNPILDFAVDPTTSQQQNLLVAAQSGNSSNYYDSDSQYQIKKLTTEAHVVWSSPSLVGRPTKHGLKARINEEAKLEILLSTSHMMYWFQP